MPSLLRTPLRSMHIKYRRATGGWLIRSGSYRWRRFQQLIIKSCLLYKQVYDAYDPWGYP
jgi:hypothetical protein